MSKKKINIAIIGATGYTGLDLVFLLTKHPNAKILNLFATKNLGKNISFFDQRIKRKLPKISSINKIDWRKIDLVFFSLPNGKAQKIIKKIYYKYKNIKFIDLSADFRITDPKKYRKNYKKKHNAIKLIKDSIYAISEFVKKDIYKYRIIANPGCYPTSIQIPLMPLIKKKLINTDNLTVDSKSGYSGAGRSVHKKYKNKNLYESLSAYGISFHRHNSEIDQELKNYTNSIINFTFTPHLTPMFRGILSTIYVDLKPGFSIKKIFKIMQKFHKKNIFVNVLKINSLISTNDVINTNLCNISICETKYKNKLIILSAVDNLIKGGAGQAIQNMNLKFGFKINEGLK